MSELIQHACNKPSPPNIHSSYLFSLLIFFTLLLKKKTIKALRCSTKTCNFNTRLGLKPVLQVFFSFYITRNCKWQWHIVHFTSCQLRHLFVILAVVYSAALFFCIFFKPFQFSSNDCLLNKCKDWVSILKPKHDQFRGNLKIRTSAMYWFICTLSQSLTVLLVWIFIL